MEHADSIRNATMNLPTTWSVHGHLAIDLFDGFVDVGRGKGRVLFYAARDPVKQVVGVNLSEAFCCQVACENAGRMRGQRASISVETTVAQDFDNPAATLVFRFDPLGADTRPAPRECWLRHTGGRSHRPCEPHTRRCLAASALARTQSALAPGDFCGRALRLVLPELLGAVQSSLAASSRPPRGPRGVGAQRLSGATRSPAQRWCVA